MELFSTRISNLLTEHDVARIARLSVASIRRWRLTAQGPRYYKIGAAVRYKPEDVHAWIDSRPIGGQEGPREPIQKQQTPGSRMGVTDEEWIGYLNSLLPPGVHAKYDEARLCTVFIVERQPPTNADEWDRFGFNGEDVDEV